MLSLTLMRKIFFISRNGLFFTFYVIYILLSLISPLDNSAKKQHFEETSTPAKRVKNASCQLVFDNTVYVLFKFIYMDI